MSTRATPAKLAREADLRHLIDELGDWARGPGPLHRKLARAIALAADRGALAPGARLPSERDLAVAVAVSRGTAVAAYDRLVADERIERRRGSGTFVVGEWATLPEGREGTALVHRLVDASAPRPTAAADVVDLSLSVLADAAAMGPVSVATADLAALEPSTGYSPWGLSTLRHALAQHVSRWGLPTTADQIVVTSGAQQAISVAAACWIRPGDAVVVDDPTYPGAIAAFQQAGARVVGVAVDHDGPDPGLLESAIASSHPALVYLQPVVHSPTGVTAGAARRRELASVLAAAGVPLVEDRALADLSWSSVPPPLGALLADTPTILVGSLGKRFWGGLRLGFLRAPAPLALRLARIKATRDLGTSAVSQVLGERLLRSATEADRRDLVDGLRRRYEHLAAALGRGQPAWRWPEPAGGLSLWVDLAGADGDALARAALAVGVAVAPPRPLHAGGGALDRVRLSFAAPVEELDAAAARLARLVPPFG